MLILSSKATNIWGIIIHKYRKFSSKLFEHFLALLSHLLLNSSSGTILQLWPFWHSGFSVPIMIHKSWHRFQPHLFDMQAQYEEGTRLISHKNAEGLTLHTSIKKGFIIRTYSLYEMQRRVEFEWITQISKNQKPSVYAAWRWSISPTCVRADFMQTFSQSTNPFFTNIY